MTDRPIAERIADMQRQRPYERASLLSVEEALTFLAGYTAYMAEHEIRNSTAVAFMSSLAGRLALAQWAHITPEALVPVHPVMGQSEEHLEMFLELQRIVGEALSDALGKLQRPAAPAEVWLGVHDAYETSVHVFTSREAAVQGMATYALTLRDDIPEGMDPEDVVANWNEISGDEYINIMGPYPVTP